MMHMVPVDERAGVGLSVSLRPNSDLVALDFRTVAGHQDGHDLTIAQADVLVNALLETLAEAGRRTA